MKSCIGRQRRNQAHLRHRIGVLENDGSLPYSRALKSTRALRAQSATPSQHKTGPRHKQTKQAPAPSIQQGQANMTIATPKPVADAISKLDAADRGECSAFLTGRPDQFMDLSLRISKYLGGSSALRHTSVPNLLPLRLLTHIISTITRSYFYPFARRGCRGFHFRAQRNYR